MRPAALVLALALAGLCPAADAPRANIVTILVDDMGWNDPGYAGNPLHPTPHIDALAARGAICTQAYAAAPNCAPSRASLLTGMYPPRHGIYTVVDERFAPGLPWQRILPAESRTDLPATSVTIAATLRDAGYATAMIGMWNLGRGRSGPGFPGSQGFSTVVQPRDLGFDPAGEAYQNAKGEYLGDRLTDVAVGFIHDHRDGPFFLYLADHAVHEPWQPKADLLRRYQAMTSNAEQAAYAATLAAVDDSVRRVVDALAKEGIGDRTYIVVTSDNGGLDRFIRPLRGGKGSLYEGGIRVPACVAGPGIPAGRRVEDAVSGIDLAPTFLAMAGLPGRSYDGVDLLPVLRGSTDHLAARTLFWHFPCYVGRNGPTSAIRDGRHSAVQDLLTGTVAVYDVLADPGQTTDLAATDPALRERLTARLRSLQQDLGAAMPSVPNPAYDPAAQPPRGKGRHPGKPAP